MDPVAFHAHVLTHVDGAGRLPRPAGIPTGAELLPRVPAAEITEVHRAVATELAAWRGATR